MDDDFETLKKTTIHQIAQLKNLIWDYEHIQKSLNETSSTEIERLSIEHAVNTARCALIANENILTLITVTLKIWGMKNVQ